MRLPPLILSAPLLEPLLCFVDGLADGGTGCAAVLTLRVTSEHRAFKARWRSASTELRALPPPAGLGMAISRANGATRRRTRANTAGAVMTWHFWAMASRPSVAVVGGGIAGCLASLVLRSRGLRPTIFDAGRRNAGGRLLGGRHPDSGVQFLRATEAPFAAIMHMLSREGLVAPWRGRFGVLGSQGGGFLSAAVLANTPIGGMLREAGEEGGSGTVNFCGFLGGDLQQHPLYVGTPSNAHVLSGLCAAANIDVVLGARVSGVERISHASSGDGSGGDGDSGGHAAWRVLIDGADDANAQAPFDALVLASHDAALAAAALRTAVLPSLQDAPESSSRLSQLVDALQAQREERTSAAFTWSGYFAPGLSERVPFDAATVPASPVVRFLARDASKPGRPAVVPIPGEGGGEAELWTAVSTAQFADTMLARESLASGESGDSDKGGGAASAASAAMSAEVGRLLAPYAASADGIGPVPLRASAKRWGAGFAAGTLGLQEECVSLEPWRLAIAGDYLSAERASPAEAAAVSGMEAAERVASWFERPE